MDQRNIKPTSSSGGNNSLGSLEVTPTSGTSSGPTAARTVYPPVRQPHRKGRAGFLVSLALLFVVTGLVFSAIRLAQRAHSNNNQSTIADTTPITSNTAVQGESIVSPLQATDGQTVTVNGNLVVAGRLQLSQRAISDLGDVLGNKVTLSPAVRGTTQVGNIAISGTMVAGNFQGNGAGLSNLNATTITTGTLANDRLDSTVTRLGQSIPLSALQPTILSTINNVANNGGNIDIVGSGDLTVTTDPSSKKIILGTTGGGDITGVIAGTGLTGGGLNGDVTLAVDSGLVTIQGNNFNGANQLVQLNGAGELPALSALNLTNLNASNLVAGTLGDNRLSGNVTLQGNTFNLPNKLVLLDSGGNLPALNGSALTNLSATHIASGTMADARLSANVALLNASQTFTGALTLTQPLTVNTIQPSSTMTIGSANQSLTLQGDLTTKLTASSGGNTVSLGFTGTPTGNVTYNLDAATTPGTYSLCTTVGNCANSGGGVTTLGGTTGKLARFTGGQSIGDSAITDTGSAVTVGAVALFKASADSTTALRVQNAAGSANVFTVDTTNTRVAIGQATAGYPLDVAGDINSTTGLRVAGNLVCNATGCSASSGSGFYVGNGISLQTGANFNIESANTSSVVGTLKGKSGQTADLLQAKNGAGSTVASIDKDGNINTTGQYRVNGAQISSANLANDSNLAKLSANQAFAGANTFTGTTKIQPATDSTSAFQIQNSVGTSNLLVADTTNTRLGIGTATPGYTVDVNGDVNITGGSSYRINGVSICGPSTTCAPAAGSSNYVQNGLIKQANANFNIQTISSGSVVGILQGASGQTADILQARDSSNTVLAKITASGAIFQGANQVCDVSNNCGYATGAQFTGAILQGGNSFGAPMAIGTNDNQSLALKTNGSSRLTITAAGDIGVNTANPQAILDFSPRSATDSAFILLRSGSSSSPRAAVKFIQGATNLGFVGYDSSQFRVDSANNDLSLVTQSGTSTVELKVCGSCGSSAWRRLILGPSGLSYVRDNSTTISNQNDSQAYFLQDTTIGSSTKLGQLGVVNDVSSDVGLVVQGAVGQTANLQEWRDSSGVVRASLSNLNNGGNQVLTLGSMETTGNWSGINLRGSYNNGNTLLSINSGGSNASIIGSGAGNALILGSVSGLQFCTNSNCSTNFGYINPQGQWKVGATGPVTSQLDVNVGSSARIGMIINGASGQTADLLQAKDSTGAVLSALNNAGSLAINANSTALAANTRLRVNKGSLVANSSQAGWVINGVTDGTQLFSSDSSAYGSPSIMALSGDVGGYTINTLGTWGAIGSLSLARAGGLRLIIGNRSVGISTGGSGDQIYGGQGIATFEAAGIGSNSAGRGLYGEVNTGQLGTAVSRTGYGVQGVANSDVGAIAYGGHFRANGAGINTALQAEAGTATTKGLVVKGFASQTADLLQIQDVNSVNMFTVGATGSALLKNSTNSTTAFQIQNAAGTNLLVADTTNNRIGIGTTPSYMLDVASTVSSTNTAGARIVLSNAVTGSQTDYGLYVDNQHSSDNGTHYGVYGQAVSQTGTGTSIGVYGKGLAGFTSYGGYFEGNGNGNANRTQYGVYGKSGVASATNSLNYGGYFELQSAITLNASNASSAALVANVPSGSTAADWILNLRNNNANKFVVNGNGGTGINTTSLGTAGLLAVNGPTTMDNAATVLFATSAISNKGLVIQGSAGQTADLLQAQDSTGAVLAKIDSAGNLTVKNATVQGTLTVTGNATLSGAYITFSNNVRGYNIAVTTSAASKAITFATAHPDANYAVMCTPDWSTTCYVTNKTVSGFTLNFGTPAPASQLLDWLVVR